mmetsp:Transcript_5771/g.23833  ORF Transcript_5771/g.23833 Transcript_5771/m.23833 type:complete len:253 (+) Transcript_5771:253-1011(+)
MTRRRATIGGRGPAGSASSRRRRGGGDLTRARRRRGRTSRCRGSVSTTPRPRPANSRVRPRPAKRSATRTTPKITRGPARFVLSPRRLGAGSPGTPRLTCPPRSRRRSNRGNGSASAAAAAAVPIPRRTVTHATINRGASSDPSLTRSPRRRRSLVRRRTSPTTATTSSAASASSTACFARPSPRCGTSSRSREAWRVGSPRLRRSPRGGRWRRWCPSSPGSSRFPCLAFWSRSARRFSAGCTWPSRCSPGR